MKTSDQFTDIAIQRMAAEMQQEINRDPAALQEFDNTLGSPVFTDTEREIIRRLYAVDAESARIVAQRIIDDRNARRPLRRRLLEMMGF